MKSRHSLIWCGDLAVFFLCLLLPANEFRKYLCKLMQLIRFLTSRKINKVELEQKRLELIEVLARLVWFGLVWFGLVWFGYVTIWQLFYYFSHSYHIGYID
jgi:hypothetical protein